MNGGRKGRWREREERRKKKGGGGEDRRKKVVVLEGTLVEEYAIREGWNGMDGFCQGVMISGIGGEAGLSVVREGW